MPVEPNPPMLISYQQSGQSGIALSIIQGQSLAGIQQDPIRKKRKLDPEIIYRPKKPKLLPNVLSKEEVKMILEAHKNIKHRAMLSLIYACGLRRGELLNLKIGDVDSKRSLLIIRQAKGRKDRVAPLSEKILELLRD